MALVDDLARAFQNAGMDGSHARSLAKALDKAAALTTQPVLTAADATAFTAADNTAITVTVDATVITAIGNLRTRQAQDEAITSNLRTRVNELEARLRANGLLV